MLNKKLVLFYFLLDQFGFQSLQELKENFSMWELVDDELQSQFCRDLLLRTGLKVEEQKLRVYDENIIADLKSINSLRSRPIRLKYYQYFTVLFVEYYLERYFIDKYSFLDDLNGYMSQFERDHRVSFGSSGGYTIDSLSKLAIWQATGAGKTFMLHFNLLQYRRYCRDINNVIVLTPSETMSSQHLQDLAESGIAAELYLNKRSGDQVKIIDINKIREVKKGQGVTVPVAEFGQKNLVLVDEGHKGSASEERIQRNLREQLAQNGFTFEYSATFGQISDEDLQTEYGKCIVFDYSYHYFWNDGYGKDYWIHNISETHELDNKEARKGYLLLNLTLFTQQKLYYELHPDVMREYRIEDPLMIFVGHTVNEKTRSQREKQDNKRTISDVHLLVDFFSDFLKRPSTYQQWLQRIYQGKYPFANEYDSQLSYIKSKYTNGQDLYNCILRLVFHSDSPGSLEVCDIQGANGEIGLRVQNSNHFFGLIYIGDTARFKSGLIGDYEVETERIRQPLFPSLNQKLPYPVNILIGARMFTEGWNNYRVSSIGLINFGRSEGSQVIQLFGRGVRLHGKNNSLKRSQGTAAPESTIVETLNIFGLNADYMARFQQEMKKEQMLVRKTTRSLPIKRHDNIAGLNLYNLERKVGAPEFSTTGHLPLRWDKHIKVVLDFSTRRLAFGSQTKNELLEVSGDHSHNIPDHHLSLLNWQQVYLKLQENRKRHNLINLSIPRSGLDGLYVQINKQLILDEGIAISKTTDINKLQQLVVAVLTKYMKQYYAARQNVYEGNLLDTVPLTEDNPNLKYDNYEIELIISDEEGRVDPEINRILHEVEALLNATDCPENLADGSQKVRATRFDVSPQLHLYQPLLFDPANQYQIKTSTGQRLITSLKPVGLNESEGQFVEDMQMFVSRYGVKLYPGAEFYLLRNISQTGTGFYFSSAGGFYPDFILWIKYQGKQYITFFDPHGLQYEMGGLNSKRISLHRDIKKLRLGHDNVVLNSFILVPPGLKDYHDWLPNSVEDIYAGFNAYNIYEIRQPAEGTMNEIEYIGQIVEKITGFS
ncbi:MAG TPA: DEAD/DEAH box helicase family protein [Gelria sp.]|nr:DEAD/DEAH box helicase family protein [Gelria sp.]